MLSNTLHMSGFLQPVANNVKSKQQAKNENCLTVHPSLIPIN